MAHPDAGITVLQFDGVTAARLQMPASGSAHAAKLHVVRAGGIQGLPQPETDAPCHIILPRHEATVRMLDLPSQDPAEIASMVRLGAPDMVPYPIEEMRVAHQCLASLPGGESRVLVVLVRQETIDGCVAAAQEAGYAPVRLFLSTACLAAAITPTASDGDVALLHVDPAAMELLVLRGGTLSFSRAITHGALWDLDSAPGREALACEARDMLAAYRRESEDGQGADTVYVSAAGLPPEPIAALLAETTGKAFELYRPALPLTDPDRECPATLAGAVRLAGGHGPLDIGLTPPHLARSRTAEAMRARLRHGAVLAAAILLALAVWFGQAVWQRHQLVNELETRIDGIAPRAQGVAAKQQGLQIISRQINRGGSFLELLAGLAASAPPEGLNITRIQFDRASGMNIWGRAQTKDLVLKDFLGAMRSRAEGHLALFAGAHSLYETAGRERNQPVVNYHITIPATEEVADADTAPPR